MEKITPIIARHSQQGFVLNYVLGTLVLGMVLISLIGMTAINYTRSLRDLDKVAVTHERMDRLANALLARSIVVNNIATINPAMVTAHNTTDGWGRSLSVLTQSAEDLSNLQNRETQLALVIISSGSDGRYNANYGIGGVTQAGDDIVKKYTFSDLDDYRIAQKLVENINALSSCKGYQRVTQSGANGDLSCQDAVTSVSTTPGGASWSQANADGSVLIRRLEGRDGFVTNQSGTSVTIKLRDDCAEGEYLQLNGSNWECTSPAAGSQAIDWTSFVDCGAVQDNGGTAALQYSGGQWRCAAQQTYQTACPSGQLRWVDNVNQLVDGSGYSVPTWACVDPLAGGVATASACSEAGHFLRYDGNNTWTCAKRHNAGVTAAQLTDVGLKLIGYNPVPAAPRQVTAYGSNGCYLVFNKQRPDGGGASGQNNFFPARWLALRTQHGILARRAEKQALEMMLASLTMPASMGEKIQPTAATAYPRYAQNGETLQFGLEQNKGEEPIFGHTPDTIAGVVVEGGKGTKGAPGSEKITIETEEAKKLPPGSVVSINGVVGVVTANNDGEGPVTVQPLTPNTNLSGNVGVTPVPTSPATITSITTTPQGQGASSVTLSINGTTSAAPGSSITFLTTNGTVVTGTVTGVSNDTMLVTVSGNLNTGAVTGVVISGNGNDNGGTGGTEVIGVQPDIGTPPPSQPNQEVQVQNLLTQGHVAPQQVAIDGDPEVILQRARATLNNTASNLYTFSIPIGWRGVLTFIAPTASNTFSQVTVHGIPIVSENDGTWAVPALPSGFNHESSGRQLRLLIDNSDSDKQLDINISGSNIINEGGTTPITFIAEGYKPGFDPTQCPSKGYGPNASGTGTGVTLEPIGGGGGGGAGGGGGGGGAGGGNGGGEPDECSWLAPAVGGINAAAWCNQGDYLLSCMAYPGRVIDPAPGQSNIFNPLQPNNADYMPVTGTYGVSYSPIPVASDDGTVAGCYALEMGNSAYLASTGGGNSLPAPVPTGVAICCAPY